MRKCITCKKETEKNEFFPFCSERCKLIDLWGWFNEEYYVSAPVPQKEMEEYEEEEDDFWRN